MPKYKIYTPRYIQGEYVHADAEHPAIIDLPLGTKIDRRLFPVDEHGAKEKAKYKDWKGNVVADRREEVEPGTVKNPFTRPSDRPEVKLPEKAGVAQEVETKGKGKRAADTEAI